MIVTEFRLRRSRIVLLALGLCVGLASTSTVSAQRNNTVPSDATVESLFDEFLHYARLGRFTTADAFAKALLEHPDMTPLKVLEASRKDQKSVQTLIIIIENSTISERAARVLELIQQGEFEKRKDPELIKSNILKLGGTPQQEYYAIKHLQNSGEYAIPFMIATLLDESQSNLHPRVIQTLPKIGKPAVNPLVMSLRMNKDNEDIRLNIIHALGEIGYVQAVPYLTAIIEDDSYLDSSKKASKKAIDRIASISGRTMSGNASEQFFRLAEKYYNEDDSVEADPRVNKANLWYFDASTQNVEATEVDQALFGPIMAMRNSEESLIRQEDRMDSISLWLAGNIRRESRLGLNIESGNPDEVADEPDPTKAENFPRALYFTQAAGPRYAHMVLERGLNDADSAVALGAIEALRLTAGESSLIGSEDYKQPLVLALQYPDLKVRSRAALALGAALPQSQFSGSQLVIPVLAETLSRTGKKHFLLIEPNEDNRNRLSAALRNGETEVVAASGFYEGINQARVEFPHISAMFIADTISDPGLNRAITELRGEFIFAHMPVIMLTSDENKLTAENLSENDPYSHTVASEMDADALMDRYGKINERTGQTPLEPDVALAMALQSTETLRAIAENGRTIFAFSQAEPALIDALSSADEGLQSNAASVLALAHSETSQRSIAHVALNDANTRSLRVSALRSLAESAKINGNMLEAKQIDMLVKLARDEADLVLRTAASEALGGVNIENDQASNILRKYYKG